MSNGFLMQQTKCITVRPMADVALGSPDNVTWHMEELHSSQCSHKIWSDNLLEKLTIFFYRPQEQRNLQLVWGFFTLSIFFTGQRCSISRWDAEPVVCCTLVVEEWGPDGSSSRESLPLLFQRANFEKRTKFMSKSVSAFLTTPSLVLFSLLTRPVFFAKEICYFVGRNMLKERWSTAR